MFKRTTEQWAARREIKEQLAFVAKTEWEANDYKDFDPSYQ